MKTYIPQEVIELEIEQQEEEQIVSFFQEQISKNHRYSPSISLFPWEKLRIV